MKNNIVHFNPAKQSIVEMRELGSKVEFKVVTGSCKPLEFEPEPEPEIAELKSFTADAITMLEDGTIVMEGVRASDG